MHLPHAAVTHPSLFFFLQRGVDHVAFESQKSIASQEWVQQLGEKLAVTAQKSFVISSRFETEVQHALPRYVSKAVWSLVIQG